MSGRKGRILLGKIGEGHKQAMLNLAKGLGEAGFEVVYTELEEPEAVVSAALQESVDHIGITTLSGPVIGTLKEIVRLLKKEGADHISVTAGGFADNEDILIIEEIGLKAFFPKGTSFEDIIEWSQQNIRAGAH